jgi:hypothetical protein
MSHLLEAQPARPPVRMMRLVEDASVAIEPAEPLTPQSAPGVVLFALTLLLSSTLLFLVQPMFAKMVLVRLGGTAAVWNTCMVFFQACLLAGYAYSHGITRRLSMRWQLALHAVVLALPLLVLPVALPTGWTPPADANPIPWLLMLLGVSVGLPFFVVSTTAPLVQRWFASTGHRHAGDPYFLYVASNAGSLVALLGYPTIIEPLLRLQDQTRLWTWGYIAFAALVLICGIRACLSASGAGVSRASSDQDTRARRPLHDLDAMDRINPGSRLKWILLAFVPSSYLLGVTTYITTDVAAVPLLWVLPLALYLLTFTLAFARKPIVSHRAMVYALPTAVLAPVLFLLVRAALPVWATVSLHLLAFFVAAMVCHGELARMRPSARHLTEFYLLMSVGGVLGGAFNALAAPLLFSRALEYPLIIVLACLLCPPRSVHGETRRPMVDLFAPIFAGVLAWVLLSIVHQRGGGITLKILALSIPVMLCVWLAGRRLPFAAGIAALLIVANLTPGDRAKELAIQRSFFGVHRIVQTADGTFNELFHGTTLHGRQHADGRAGDEPLTYYHRGGPIGSIMAGLPSQNRQNIAVIGLGVGSLAAYANEGDRYTFYEIDPVVRWVADGSGYFNYLPSARTRGAEVGVVLGDARLTLTSAAPKSIDLLVLDAFSGDAIPLHLLTREALATYLDKLKPNGLLAVHISNLYLDLEPVIANLAADAGCVAFCKDDVEMSPERLQAGAAPSKWMLVARTREPVENWAAGAGWKNAVVTQGRRVWTDDYSNILSTLR